MPCQLRREDYTVGWVCALPAELAAAKAMLDEKHDDSVLDASDNRENIYCMGSIAGHNVVIVCLPAGRIGSSPAATVATQMQATFKGIRFGLMVGIGGGVPTAEADIRLGDVVVSHPQQTLGGVVQYDFGKATPSGFQRTGLLNSPPPILLSAMNTVQANVILDESKMSDYVSKLERNSRFQRSKAGPDILFEATYHHERGHTCDQCSVDRYQTRPNREIGEDVVVHYGTIASGNQVIKNAAERDRVSAELGGVLCFEMEAAGLMNSFPCLAIRGICDYADSHKNKRWQTYAAGTAAAYAKELLSVIPAADVISTRRAEEAMHSGNKRDLQPLSPEYPSSKRRRTDFPSGTENNVLDQRTVTLPTHHRERNRTSLDDEQKRVLLDSLRFEQIDARLMTIKNAHAKTCTWLLKSAQYRDWLDATKLCEHHGFLWIKGKAGTGKSTLMKSTFINARKKMKDRIVLSFFFNARGENMEKSTIGTYQSLLLQLLESLPILQSVFNSLGLLASNFTADYRWNIELLKTLLEEAIQALGKSSAVCFIDALDECEEEEVREMFEFLERVSELAVSKGIRFQVCFSSRHYPHITIKRGLELVLEGHEGHTQDITNYVEAELKIGKSKIAQQIRIDLQQKASGIFMWVVLVVGILNRESDRGNVHTLQRKLKEIPSSLYDLFRDILTRDSDNKDALVLCIQWVLFAKKPLNPEQLYYAIHSGINPDVVSKWYPEEVSSDVVKRFILNSSKGLTEITVSKEQKVQFIHESVRDFLLKENGLSKIWSEFTSNFYGQSHERLKQCCLNYITDDITTFLEIPNDRPKAFSKQAAGMRNSAIQIYPFLEYAVHNVLYHADTAEGSGISQAGFLDSFPLPQWINLNNILEKHEVRTHTERASLLYVLAELNTANLIGIVSSDNLCLQVEDERYGCPLFAAAATGSEEAVQLCMKSIRENQVTARPLDAVGVPKSQRKLAQCVARRDFVYSKKKGFFLCAAELGHDEILTHLINTGVFEINSKDSKERTALWWASRNGCETSMRSLLIAGSAMVNSKDRDNKTPLLIAAEKGNDVATRLLLENGADVNAQGGHFSNALYAASAGGFKEVVALLLDKGADVNAWGGEYCNALQVASFQGFKEVVALLLDKGAEVNARGGYYGNALCAASVIGYKEVVMLLLDNGADVNRQNGHFGNALQAASTETYEEVVTLLLDRGADVNASGGHFGNALQAASSESCEEVVALLLDKGADVNARGGYYSNALQAASARGHKGIVTLLLDRGADINAQGGYYGNALQAASIGGDKKIVMLLLDKGADINAQGGEHGNALQAASIFGQREIVALLLDKGALKKDD